MYVKIFDASHLHIFKSIMNNEDALNELAQLITEVNGGITARGDVYKNRDFSVKKKFHHVMVYESIKAIYGTSEEKTPYCLIPKLYNLAGFNEGMSIEKLPTEKLLAADNQLEEKMRKGLLYARAMVCPTKLIDPKNSKRDGKPKSPETRGEFEVRKAKRTPEEVTLSGATGKLGFNLRSGSVIGYNSELFGGVGLLYRNKT